MRPSPSDLTRHWRLVAALAFFAVTLVVYGYGAFHSPVLDPALAERRSYLKRIIEENSPDLAEERRFAKLYWDAYPHVGQDRYYGENGVMGLLGAQEHYNRHGRHDGLLWGEALARQRGANPPAASTP